MSPSKLIIGAAIVAAGLAGGAVAASDYPPAAPPSENAVLSSSSAGQAPQGPQAVQRAGGQLAETGSDADTLIKVAGGAVVAGAGLVVVTRLRRRPALA